MYLKIRPIGFKNKCSYYKCLFLGSWSLLLFKHSFGMLGKYLRRDIVIKKDGLIYFVRKQSDDISYYGHSTLSFKSSTNKWLQPKIDDVVIDCGAGVAIFSIFSAIVGSKVISIEPNPETFNVLKMNISLNKLSIETYNVALTEFNGTQKLYVPKSNFGLSSTLESWFDVDLKDKIFTVKSATLDSITVNITKINWLLIDTEGGELDLLKGGYKSLDKTCKIIIEISDRNREGVFKLLELKSFELIQLGSRHGDTEYGFFKKK